VLPEIDANENISVKGEVKQSTENANKTSCSNVSA
jgi:hypothetical protein